MIRQKKTRMMFKREVLQLHLSKLSPFVLSRISCEETGIGWGRGKR